MKCAYSREILALYVEGDLPGSHENNVKLHLMECPECQQFCQQLEQSQSLLKSLRQKTVSPTALSGVRRAVLSRIESRQDILGWRVKLERFILLGVRKPRYAAAGLCIIAIVSASLLGQMQQSPYETGGQAGVFEGKDTLVRPDGYREWVFAGSTLGLDHSGSAKLHENRGSEFFHNVYIDPSAYRTYAVTGEFPEGTVMILETASAEVKEESGLQGSYEKAFVSLEASVKDSSRFDGGWGYFDFTDGEGKLKTKSQALPEERGCRSCHQTRAETDHVFTQFYPVLRLVGAKS